MIKAVLFDLFGTLLQFQRSERPLRIALDSMQLSAQERRTARTTLMTHPAPTLQDAVDLIARRTGRTCPPNALQRAQDALQRHLDSCVPAPGALPLLRALRARDLRLAVVSNLAEVYAPLLHQHSLSPLLDHTTFSFALGLLKPDPQIFTTTLHTLGVPPAQAVMVGDTWHSDVEGAHAAGLRAVWRSSTSRPGVPSVPSLEHALPILLAEP